MTKCASTAIEDELFEYAQLVTRKNPTLKHMHYRGFKRFIAPMLHRHGYPRDSYEVVCVMREPVSWLHSWWRYRGRPQLANAEGPRRRNYTGDLSFEQFVQAYIAQSETYATSIGRQANFVRGPNNQMVGVDRVFRYEELGSFLDYASERVGSPLTLDRTNVSPRTKLKLPRSTRRELQEFLATEYYIYETLANGEYIEIPVPEAVDSDDSDDGDDDTHEFDVTDGVDDAEAAARAAGHNDGSGRQPVPAEGQVAVPNPANPANGAADRRERSVNADA
jgi:hypothetical protein